MCVLLQGVAGCFSDYSKGKKCFELDNQPIFKSDFSLVHRDGKTEGSNSHYSWRENDSVSTQESHTPLASDRKRKWTQKRGSFLGLHHLTINIISAQVYGNVSNRQQSFTGFYSSKRSDSRAYCLRTKTPCSYLFNDDRYVRMHTCCIWSRRSCNFCWRNRAGT